MPPLNPSECINGQGTSGLALMATAPNGYTHMGQGHNIGDITYDQHNGDNVNNILNGPISPCTPLTNQNSCFSPCVPVTTFPYNPVSTGNSINSYVPLYAVPDQIQLAPVMSPRIEPNYSFASVTSNVLYGHSTVPIFSNNMMPISNDESSTAHNTNLCAPSLNTDWSIINRLDVVWNGKFNQCFSQFGPDEWELSPTVDTPEGDWKTFQDSAKIRFMCTTNGCNNCWTSMKGRVQFWYVLLPQYGARGKGYVFFQLYGQKCKRCKSDSFMNPIWYPEEVVKVVENIFSKVGQEYYGKEACYSTLHRERRAGKPRERHDSDLCQACAQNKCTEANL